MVPKECGMSVDGAAQVWLSTSTHWQTVGLMGWDRIRGFKKRNPDVLYKFNLSGVCFSQVLVFNIQV